jgi:hypothetical protein
MIGIRSTLPVRNRIYRLYDCGIYWCISTELPSGVYDAPIDEVNLGCTSPFKILQHGFCLNVRLCARREHFSSTLEMEGCNARWRDRQKNARTRIQP